MKTVTKSVLKAKMLEYFREIEKTGEELIVTDHHRPVLRVIPIKPKNSAADVFAEFQGKVVYKEDIRTPTSSEWNET
jgi:antitoxin (DNA-binding transcriptional repressor) of toxin-antitoxin stability system